MSSNDILNNPFSPVLCNKDAVKATTTISSMEKMPPPPPRRRQSKQFERQATDRIDNTTNANTAQQGNTNRKGQQNFQSLDMHQTNTDTQSLDYSITSTANVSINSTTNVMHDTINNNNNPAAESSNMSTDTDTLLANWRRERQQNSTIISHSSGSLSNSNLHTISTAADVGQNNDTSLLSAFREVDVSPRGKGGGRRSLGKTNLAAGMLQGNNTNGIITNVNGRHQISNSNEDRRPASQVPQHFLFVTDESIIS